MEILFVSPEVVPLSKAGGLGDVIGALPKTLRTLGHKVTVLSLLHGGVDLRRHALARRLQRLSVPLGSRVVEAEMYEARMPSGVQVVLLAVQSLTERERIYGEPDDHVRYALLCHGAIEWLKAQRTLPQVVHCHDWTTGLVPLLLRRAAQKDPRLASVRTVFSIHSIAHQGLFAPETLKETGLPFELFNPSGVEFYGKVCWLKSGVLFADRITTDSPSAAREMLRPPHGAGLEGVLKSRNAVFEGILNGVDYAVWNPATDPLLTSHFDPEDLRGRLACRTDLLARTGLSVQPRTPLLGFVGRLDAHKGIDLLANLGPRLARQDLGLVVLGEGEGPATQTLLELAKRFPERVHVTRGFDEGLAHRIYAGSDFFLAPARAETTGLTHLYAMRYGSVPIARAVGALRDTLVDCDPRLTSGNAFLFENPDPEEFFGAIGRALAAWRDEPAMARLRRRVLRKDLSWERAARQYQSLYAQLTSNGEAHADPA